MSFTGSAATAQRLRSHPAIVGNAVRFNAEADSLNLSILGPDATAGTPEFDLYVGQLVTEMTVKAGQKCTAIRRAFVPAGQLDAVAAAVADRLREVVVGNPANPAVRMGALASLQQREEVRRSLKALLAAGTAGVGRSRAGAGSGRRSGPRRLPRAHPAPGRRSRPGRAARGRGVRAGVDAAAVRGQPSRWWRSRRAAGAAWSDRS